MRGLKYGNSFGYFKDLRTYFQNLWRVTQKFMICCSVQWLRKLKSTSYGDFAMLFLLKNYNDKFHARINVIAQRQKCNKKNRRKQKFQS